MKFPFKGLKLARPVPTSDEKEWREEFTYVLNSYLNQQLSFMDELKIAVVAQDVQSIKNLQDFLSANRDEHKSFYKEAPDNMNGELSKLNNLLVRLSDGYNTSEQKIEIGLRILSCLKSLTIGYLDRNAETLAMFADAREYLFEEGKLSKLLEYYQRSANYYYHYKQTQEGGDIKLSKVQSLKKKESSILKAPEEVFFGYNEAETKSPEERFLGYVLLCCRDDPRYFEVMEEHYKLVQRLKQFQGARARTIGIKKERMFLINFMPYVRKRIRLAKAGKFEDLLNTWSKKEREKIDTIEKWLNYIAIAYPLGSNSKLRESIKKLEQSLGSQDKNETTNKMVKEIIELAKPQVANGRKFSPI